MNSIPRVFLLAIVLATGCVSNPTSAPHGSVEVYRAGFAQAFQHANSTLLELMVLESASLNVSPQDSTRIAQAFMDNLDRVEGLAANIIRQDNTSDRVMAENVTIDRTAARISATLPTTRFMSMNLDARFVLKNGTVLTPRDMTEWGASITKRWLGSLDFRVPPNSENLTSISLLIYEAKPGARGFSYNGDDNGTATLLKSPRIREIQNWTVTAHLPSGETLVATAPPRFDGEYSGSISTTIPIKGVRKADLAFRILLDDGMVLTEKDVDIRSPYPE